MAAGRAMKTATTSNCRTRACTILPLCGCAEDGIQCLFLTKEFEEYDPAGCGGMGLKVFQTSTIEIRVTRAEEFDHDGLAHV